MYLEPKTNQAPFFASNLDEVAISGKCPETVFIGVVPKDINTASEELTPEIKEKIPEVVDMILEEINKDP
jgi:Ni,Fe-hydrogenase maturation factor